MQYSLRRPLGRLETKSGKLRTEKAVIAGRILDRKLCPICDPFSGADGAQTLIASGKEQRRPTSFSIGQ